MAQSTCSFPGCVNRVRDRQECKLHRNPEVPGYRDVYCKICLAGPFSSLAGHLRLHNIRAAEYKSRYQVDAVVSEDVRFNHGAIWSDRVEDGTLTPYQRRKTCIRGHRLVGANVLVNVTPDGKTHRHCRACQVDAQRRRYQAGSAWRKNRRSRKCRWCGEMFLPVKPNQWCCSTSHSIKLRESKAPQRHADRNCLECGTRFTPLRATCVVCRDPECRRRKASHRAKAWRDSALQNDHQPATTARTPLPEHGQRARYNRGCRCSECREANNRYHIDRRRKSSAPQ